MLFSRNNKLSGRLAPHGLYGLDRGRPRSASNGKEYDSFILDAGGGANGKFEFLYHMHKDACLPSKSTQYLSRLFINVSGVSQAELDKGIVIRVGIKELPYSGSRAASIKPAADGKYRGEPILLMSSVGYGNEYVNVVKRKSHVVRSRKRIPVVKYVSYKGYSLSLSRLRGMLRGGQATFELSNGGYIYGVCFKLVRKRQVTNGYPK